MKILSLLIFILFNLQNLFGQSITVTGDWNYSIPSVDITEAGLDFTGTYENNVNQVYLDIQYNNKWQVSVDKNNIDWNSRFRLFVKRTGDGIGTKKVNRGKNYIRIRNNARIFFTGNKDRMFIPLQYKIERVSVVIPANTYVVEIVYTLSAR